MPVTTTRLIVNPWKPRAALLARWVRRQQARLRPPGTARPADPWPYRWSRRRPSPAIAVPRLICGESRASGRRYIRASCMVGSTMPENLTSPTPSARPLPGCTEPTQEEAEQLPQRVETEAARHDRIALEMAGEEPEFGLRRRARPRSGPCRARRPLPRHAMMRSNISIGGNGS